MAGEIIFEYKCPQCGTYYEVPKEQVAPVCCAQDCQRVFRKLAFVLQGEGWHGRSIKEK